MIARKLVAGNWKMNGLVASAALFGELEKAVSAPRLRRPDLPACHVIARVAGGAFPVGGQDCHPQASGTFTGDISAEMLSNAGAVAVIVGHSERRTLHGDPDDRTHLAADRAAAEAG